MKDLYAPWRSPYSSSDASHKDANALSTDCVFCSSAKQDADSTNFILKRYTHCFAILNKYPYNAGHIMVIPYEHVKKLSDVSSEAQHEIISVISQATTIVETHLKAEGINIGLNIGPASGAGIPGHLHWHVLPRWNGDTNFLPTLANTKVISFDLKEIYDLLLPHFK
ncbi:HIT domain-containing protein [soil metagenome]